MLSFLFFDEYDIKINIFATTLRLIITLQMQTQEIIATLNQLDELAKTILSTHFHHRIFSFCGEMGAGKTTLIKALCKYLNVQNIPSSPTFAIVNEYWTSANEPIYHFDFYRIEQPEEAIAIGLFEYLESGRYCFMEWTENIEAILNEVCVKITIERIDNQTRKFTF
jgi:tRNA threonylcarbamoyladenosine biosynthesis protein TsaE